MLPCLTALCSFAAPAVLAYYLQPWSVVPLSRLVDRVGYSGLAFFALSGFVLA